MKNHISHTGIFKVVIFFMFFLFFLSFNYSKAQNLITCLDNSGNIAYVLDAIYSCPPGTTQGNPNFNLVGIGTTTPIYNPTTTVINTNFSNNTNYSNPAVFYNQVNNSQNISQSTPILNTFGEPINFTANSSNNYQNGEKPETIINFDPNLAYGAFVNLDPTDYKYCVMLTRDLSYGARDASNGNEISALQSYLTDRGFLEYGATGFFGRATDLAVKKFQYRNEIEVTGSINNETREIIKELTCKKQMVYVDKPISPSKVKLKTVTATPIKKTTVIPTTKAAPSNTVSKPKVVAEQPVVALAPSINNTQVAQTSQNTQQNVPQILSSYGGNMSISQKNNLYFSYNTFSIRPFICINLNNTDCNSSSNYAPVSEGVLKNFYEVINISGQWAFTIYNVNTWGPAGTKTKIYLKENAYATSYSVYTINVVN